MSRGNSYKTWNSMNNDQDSVGGQAAPKPVSEYTIELKDANHLKFALKNTRFVIVKAEADWCEPCKVLAPAFEALAKKCKGCDKFIYMTDDIDKETSCHATKVTAVPSFFVYTDGDPIHKKHFTGDFDQLEELINRILFRVQEDDIKTAAAADAKKGGAQPGGVIAPITTIAKNN